MSKKISVTCSSCGARGSVSARKDLSAMTCPKCKTTGTLAKSNQNLPWYSAGSAILTAGYWVLIVFGVLLFLPVAFDGTIFGALIVAGVFGGLAFGVRLLGKMGAASDAERKNVAQENVTQKKNLVTCPDCGKDVSRNAEACPHCGNKALPTLAANSEAVSHLIGLVIFAAIVVFVWRGCSSSDSVKEKKKPLTHKEKIKSLFSPWDGSHYGLVRHVKKRMNDADSFEHVKTYYVDQEDQLLLTMTFRGKNAFGAKVLQNISAVSDLKGNIKEVIHTD